MKIVYIYIATTEGMKAGDESWWRSCLIFTKCVEAAHQENASFVCVYVNEMSSRRFPLPPFFFFSFGVAPNPKCLKKKLVYSKKINDNNEGA